MKNISQFEFRRVHVALMLAWALIPAHAVAQESTDNPEKNVNPIKTETKTEIKTELPVIKITTGRVRPGKLGNVGETGSKTDTPARDIPATVDVVPATLLREQGVINMNDAMRNVSSVQPLMGGGYGFANNYTSRGLPLSFFRDNMPDGTSPQNGYYRTMYDVERIEVLKGPGSALFGVAGPGGSINMITKPPQRRLGMTAGTMIGSFGTYNGFVDVTAPTGNRSAGRLISDIEHADGFRGLERNIYEVSPSFVWHLADDKTLLIDYDHRDIHIKPDNYGTVFDGNSRLSVPRNSRYYSPFDRTSNIINRISAVHNWTISDDLTMRTAFTNDIRTLDMIRNGGGNQACGSGPYLLGSPCSTFGEITKRDARAQLDNWALATFQNEFIWKTNTGPVKHTFLGGFEYKNTDIATTRSDINLPPVNLYTMAGLETSLNSLGAFTPTFDRRIKSDQTSFYAQDQIDLSEQFKLRLGIRNDLVQWSDKGLQATKGVVYTDSYREIVETKSITTYSTGGVYQPTKNLAFYAGYSTGAFVNLSTEAQAVSTAPETSNQIEVGAKTTLLDGKADVNVALFQTTRSNYFITLPSATGANNATPDGKDWSRGVEVTMGLRPIDGLSIRGTGVWMDPETLSRNVATNAVLGIRRSVFGGRPVGVATNMASLWNSYQIQSGIARGVVLGFGVTYKGDSYADTLNLLRVPAYVVFDAAISYRIKRVDLAVNVKNLTNKSYYTNPTFAGALPGNPLSAFGSIRFNFN